LRAKKPGSNEKKTSPHTLRLSETPTRFNRANPLVWLRALPVPVQCRQAASGGKIASMTTSEIEGLHELLAGIYAILRRNEQSLVQLKIQTEAAITASKESNPRFAKLFDSYEKVGLRTVRKQHEAALALYDGVVQQLRDT